MVHCPACNSPRIFVIDKGLKKVIRFLMRNNRFACRDCHYTWREHTAHIVMKLRRKRKDELY